MYRLIRTTPSSIVVQSDERNVEVLGESFDRGHGSPDFIIHISSVKNWEDPGGSYPISIVERKSLIDFILLELQGRGWDIVAE
jgi:hypothetical protein